MKKLSYLFFSIAIILSDIMCFVVAYNYRSMICGIEHQVFSAPANIAFIQAIPYLICILVSIILAIKCRKKYNINQNT